MTLFSPPKPASPRRPQAPERHPEPLVTPISPIESKGLSGLESLQMPHRSALHGPPLKTALSPEFQTLGGPKVLLQLGGETLTVDKQLRRHLWHARKDLSPILRDFSNVEKQLLVLLDGEASVAQAQAARRAISTTLQPLRERLEAVHPTLDRSLQPLTEKMLKFIQAATNSKSELHLADPNPPGISSLHLLASADAVRIVGRISAVVGGLGLLGAGPLTYGIVAGTALSIGAFARIVSQEPVLAKIVLGRNIPARELPALRQLNEALLGRTHQKTVTDFLQAGGHLDVLLTKTRFYVPAAKTAR